ncbi:MAG: FAD-dependent oxidoreductase, partial [Candidatus Bathyarchaeota archaeon]
MRTVVKSVVIVGSGVGGIYVAAMLAKHGYRVTVVEKNQQAGGRCNFLEKDGHSFDTGPTLLMMPKIFARAFSDLGEKMEDHLNLLHIDPKYHIFFHDGTKLAICSDQKRLKEQLEAIEPNSYEAFQRYLNEGERFYKLAMPNFIDRDFRGFFEYFNLRSLFLAFKLKVLVNHYNYVGRFFRETRLKEAFTFRDAYLGLNPFEAPAMFSML